MMQKLTCLQRSSKFVLCVRKIRDECEHPVLDYIHQELTVSCNESPSYLQQKYTFQIQNTKTTKVWKTVNLLMNCLMLFWLAFYHTTKKMYPFYLFAIVRLDLKRNFIMIRYDFIQVLRCEAKNSALLKVYRPRRRLLCVCIKIHYKGHYSLFYINNLSI